uniref:DUF5069 domain-containing protein n=1 Tax=uncultured marine microorganism HF4000_APKG3D20 TaxID=455549 RepID=B3T7C2_9ZZZZ|nr:hypothetical protein ALOHA_HF4000APKG3D20ctg1g29 [uncultured marine microorganism HF4000_APKG3D20]
MHHDYQERLTRIWKDAVARYQGGQASPEGFLQKDDLDFIESLGMNLMDVFDFAEDWVCEGEPDLGTFLLIHDARRDYFLRAQRGQVSGHRMDSSTLPAKTDEVEGIRWLPRIIPKARAKLRGELPVDTMYCCGGDRNFFRTNDVHPSEFLRVVRDAGDDDESIVKWVTARSPSV